ncbi:hypothetical protein LWI29_013672 [Acer saccharum]|uniref:Uncharacterized protein n=1 Tax=Acer saccharum TaxID=4024 RepID=A0AA39V0W9_ACESA|nr:hypothetical protein LWI29_013672 [Acer saccharum]
MYNHRTTTSFVSSPDDPPSKKKLFYDTDFQTHKSTVHTLSPPSTIADLYSAIASLIKESDSKTDRDGELLFKQAEKNDVQADATSNVMAMEESVGQAEAASKSDGVASKIDFEKHSSDPRADALAVSKMVEDVDNRTILDENELKEINNYVEFCIQEIVQKVNLKRRWDFLMEEMEAVRAIQEVQMSDLEKGNEGKGQEMRKKDSKTTRGNKKKDPPIQEVQMSD